MRRVQAAGLALLVWVGGACRCAAGEDSPSAPRIAPADQKLVTWVVRRTLEQYAADGSTYDPPYRPAHLAALRMQIAVTLRRGGVAVGVGVSPMAPILEAAQQAALKAFEDAAGLATVDADALERMRIEIEAIGTVVAAPVVPYWGTAQSYAFLEPGVHGIVLDLQGAKGAMRPSEFIGTGYSVVAALRSLSERMNPEGKSHQGMLASWFRTAHWHELWPHGDVVELQRGLIVLPPEVVTRRSLAKAIDSIAAYLAYRQKPSGEFSYQYEPSADRYSGSNNFARQAETAWCLAHYAAQTDDETATRVAKKAVRSLARYVTDLQGVEDAGYFLGPDRSADLAATALLCLALTDCPASEESRAVRDKLVAGMLWLQRPSGRFINVFPPALVERSSEVPAGQALLALARVYTQDPQERILHAFEAALPFCRDHFHQTPQAGFAAWQTRAFALMARRTGHRRYADFVFEMSDGLVGRQLGADNCEWPELYGGIDPPGRERVSAVTCIHLESLADALELARELGEAKRAKRYQQAVRAAARFVMQLQFRPQEGFYVRSTIDCYGGIRRSPWDSRLRIDNSARALTALNRTRQVLFHDH